MRVLFWVNYPFNAMSEEQSALIDKLGSDHQRWMIVPAINRIVELVSNLEHAVDVHWQCKANVVIRVAICGTGHH